MKQMITRWAEGVNGLRRKQNGQWVSFDDHVHYVKMYQKKIKILEKREDKITVLKAQLKMLQDQVRKLENLNVQG